MDDRTLHTYQEAAAILRQPSDWWLRRNISKLPHVKIGRQVLFTDEDLSAILQTCRVRSVPSKGLSAPSAPAPMVSVPGLIPSKARRRQAV
ncbi:hypothetical protein AB0B92_13640 [Streptomyces hygroscopicus]|uniref:hypothetical protein n=1 Tax=Streptomyces hygroscopicus TaxID=1912 RepID=UPI0033F69872